MSKQIYPIKRVDVVLDKSIERLVFVSDFHAFIDPLTALSELLNKDLRKTQIIACGDVFWGGDSPTETLKWVCENAGNLAVLGNHDEIAHANIKNGVNPYPWTACEEEVFNALPNNLQDYFSQLPNEINLTWRDKKIFVTHGSRTKKEKAIPHRCHPEKSIECFADDYSDDLIVFGHTHCPFIAKRKNGSHIANCGSTSGVAFGLIQENGEVISQNPEEPFVQGQKVYSTYLSVTIENNKLLPEIVKFDYDRDAMINRIKDLKEDKYKNQIRLVEHGIW